nr:glucose-inhibited division protein B [Cryptomonas curvata]|mmetsp:Transcript_44284/g.92602  ORF Transcript_44284/g.92602 Transcript_44284/m.92602 type:complete len:265 (+) Transcript_44284:1144-1938(+)
MFVQIHSYKNNNLNLCSKFQFSNSLKEKKKTIDCNYYETQYIRKKIQKFHFQLVKNCVIFIEHLLIRNKYTNLVSKQTILILYKKHFLDSLTVSSFFNSLWPSHNNRLCLDIGTGGGFPGFILSIMFPQIFFCLIDSIGKKINFHSKISSFLEIKNCKTLCIRAESLGKIKKHNNCYSLILARAVSDISTLIELCAPILNNSGKLLMMKKIKNNSEELRNSMFLMHDNKIKIKSTIITSTVGEGKIIIIFNNIKTSIINKNNFN